MTSRPRATTTRACNVASQRAHDVSSMASLSMGSDVWKCATADGYMCACRKESGRTLEGPPTLSDGPWRQPKDGGGGAGRALSGGGGATGGGATGFASSNSGGAFVGSSVEPACPSGADLEDPAQLDAMLAARASAQKDLVITILGPTTGTRAISMSDDVGESFVVRAHPTRARARARARGARAHPTSHPPLSLRRVPAACAPHCRTWTPHRGDATCAQINLLKRLNSFGIHSTLPITTHLHLPAHPANNLCLSRLRPRGICCAYAGVGMELVHAGASGRGWTVDETHPYMLFLQRWWLTGQAVYRGYNVRFLDATRPCHAPSALCPHRPRPTSHASHASRSRSRSRSQVLSLDTDLHLGSNPLAMLRSPAYEHFSAIMQLDSAWAVEGQAEGQQPTDVTASARPAPPPRLTARWAACRASHSPLNSASPLARTISRSAPLPLHRSCRPVPVTPPPFTPPPSLHTRQERGQHVNVVPCRGEPAAPLDTAASADAASADTAYGCGCGVAPAPLLNTGFVYVRPPRGATPATSLPQLLYNRSVAKILARLHQPADVDPKTGKPDPHAVWAQDVVNEVRRRPRPPVRPPVRPPACRACAAAAAAHPSGARAPPAPASRPQVAAEFAALPDSWAAKFGRSCHKEDTGCRSQLSSQALRDAKRRWWLPRLDHSVWLAAHPISGPTAALTAAGTEEGAGEAAGRRCAALRASRGHVHVHGAPARPKEKHLVLWTTLRLPSAADVAAAGEGRRRRSRVSDGPPLPLPPLPPPDVASPPATLAALPRASVGRLCGARISIELSWLSRAAPVPCAGARPGAAQQGGKRCPAARRRPPVGRRRAIASLPSTCHLMPPLARLCAILPARRA